MKSQYNSALNFLYKTFAFNKFVALYVDILGLSGIMIYIYLANLLKDKDAKLRCLSENRMIDRLHLFGVAGFCFCEVIF